MKIIAAAFASLLLITSANAAPDTRMGLGIAKFWFERSLEFGCVDPNGNDIRCKITPDTKFNITYSPDSKKALVVVDYIPDSTGNGTARAVIITGETEMGSWGVDNTAVDVRGQGVSAVKFTAARVSFKTKIKRDSDPQCCATGLGTVTVALTRDGPVLPYKTKK